VESKRVLVVGHRSVATPSLIEELKRRAESGPVATVVTSTPVAS